MSDATRVLDGLRAYVNALEAQLIHLRDDGQRLQAAWSAARAVYQGHGAEVFAEGFERAQRSADKYAEGAEQVLPLLRERIAALERYDSAGAGV
jgi:uncharacterized protein YukE